MTVLDPDPEAGPRHEFAALATGVLVFFASFLPWYGVKLSGPAETGVDGTYDAWHSLAAVGLILLLLSMVVAAAGPMIGEAAAGLPSLLTASVLSCAGATLVIVRSLSLPSAGVPGATSTLKWGGWVLIVLVLLQALVNILRVVHANDGRPSPDELGDPAL